MKVKINQLDEQVNESNTDFIVQRLKKENDQLHQLVNKYHESKIANRELDDLKAEKVGINYLECTLHVATNHLGTYRRSCFYNVKHWW